MKKNNYLTYIYKVFFSIYTLCILSSCINQSENSCVAGMDSGINLRFRYTYNIKESDAFGYEVGEICVWIFDSDDIFVYEYIDDGGDRIINGFNMYIPSLPLGDYTFVAWANSAEIGDEYSKYKYSDMVQGVSTLTDLTARLLREDTNNYDKRLNGSLNGMAQATVVSEEQAVTIDMLKCTNTMRIILMPYRPEQQLDVDDYEFLIKGRNGWLSYDASLYCEDPLTYLPYYAETLRGEQVRSLSVRNAENGVIDNAAVAEINISRLFYELAPRFVIKDRKSDKTLMDINLTWFLSLQAIGERKAEWSDQEYLDRQDRYAITFFIDNDVFMLNQIIVNGWVVSLEDNELS